MIVGFDLEKSTFVELIIFFENVIDSRLKFFFSDAGEKSQTACIDANNGNTGILNEGYSVEKSSVATNAEEKVDVAIYVFVGVEKRKGSMKS